MGVRILGAFIGLVFVFALLVLFTGLGAILQRTFGTYNEETRRQIFTQSQTYNDGNAIDLDNLCRQRRQATDPQTKAALADTIILRGARLDSSKLPPHVQDCLKEVFQ